MTEPAFEWTDGEGQRVVIRDGRISVYGKPSMTSDSGQVAIGANIPSGVLIIPDEVVA